MDILVVCVVMVALTVTTLHPSSHEKEQSEAPEEVRARSCTGVAGKSSRRISTSKKHSSTRKTR
jgi:hypothetical protein